MKNFTTMMMVLAVAITFSGCVEVYRSPPDELWRVGLFGELIVADKFEDYAYQFEFFDYEEYEVTNAHVRIEYEGVDLPPRIVSIYPQGEIVEDYPNKNFGRTVYKVDRLYLFTEAARPKVREFSDGWAVSVTIQVSHSVDGGDSKGVGCYKHSNLWSRYGGNS